MQNLINSTLVVWVFRVSVAYANSPQCEVLLVICLHFLTPDRCIDFWILHTNEPSVKIAGCNLSLCCWHLSGSVLPVANEIWGPKGGDQWGQPRCNLWLTHSGVTWCKLHRCLWPEILYRFPKWLFSVPQLSFQVLFFVMLWVKQNVSGLSFVCLLVLRRLTEEE